MECAQNLRCWPLLKPQMTGLPLFPGAVTVKESVSQSPMEPPTVIKREGKF
jgi:hypothetical protein